MEQMEFDEIKALEEKIEALLAFLERLKQEKENMARELEEKKQRIEALEAEVARLKEERTQVRNRVQNLLSRLEQVATG